MAALLAAGCKRLATPRRPADPVDAGATAGLGGRLILWLRHNVSGRAAAAGGVGLTVGPLSTNAGFRPPAARFEGVTTR